MTFDRRWLLPALAALLLIVAACGDDDDDDGNAQPAPGTSTPAATMTAEPSEEPTAEPTEAATAEPTAAPTEEPADDGSTHDLQIVNFSHVDFTVAVGETVRWTNVDGTAHTTTGRDGDWDSGSMRDGSRFGHTFAAAGTFEYFCTIHPQMMGTITVE